MSSAATQQESNFFAQKMTRRQNLTKRILALLALGAIAAVVFTAQKGWSTSSPVAAGSVVGATNQPLPVVTVLADRVQSYTRERHYTGLLREVRRSQLSFQRGGEVVKLLVDQGQPVEAGQLLGQLDKRHIQAAQQQLAAQIQEAKAVLDELIAGPRQETIAAKQAELRAQQAQSQILAKQLARRKQLLDTASVSKEEYETFLFDYEAAVARTDVIQRQLDELLAGTRVEQIAAQRARLAQFDAQMADLVHDLEDTTLVAPFAGRVAQRLIDEGTVISASTPVFEIIDDTHLEAWIGLPTAGTKAITVGDQRELVIEGQTVMAEVQSLAPDVDQATRTRNAILKLETSNPRLLPGQVVRLAVDEQVLQSGFWLPTTALTRGSRGLWAVYVVEGAKVGEVARRDVELLDTVGNQSFVRGSLQSGEQVIASGTHRVVVGQQVAIDINKQTAHSEL